VSYEQHLAEDARMIVLKELALQTDRRLNESVLGAVLDTFGHRRSREWVRTQLRALKELGAVTLHEAGTIFVVELTQLGLDHVDSRAIIDGIRRPSPARG